MEASESLSCENNTSTLFSAVSDSSNMYLNKDSNLISISFCENLQSMCNIGSTVMIGLENCIERSEIIIYVLYGCTNGMTDVQMYPQTY